MGKKANQVEQADLENFAYLSKIPFCAPDFESFLILNIKQLLQCTYEVFEYSVACFNVSLGQKLRSTLLTSHLKLFNFNSMHGFTLTHT